MKESKREIILDAALTLFADRGFEGTTVPMIVEKAGVGAGTIYRYFENMEALVNILFQECLQRFLEKMQKNFPYSATSMREQFHHIFTRMVMVSKENADMLLFIDNHCNARYLNETSKDAFQQLLSFIREFIDIGKEQGIIRQMPSDALIAIVYGAFMGLNKAIQVQEITETPELLADTEEACWDAIRKH